MQRRKEAKTQGESKMGRGDWLKGSIKFAIRFSTKVRRLQAWF